MRFFYGIKNLRSLDVPISELRPITLLVGRNNSGKSSLLRTFPLLKQSVVENVAGPISWHGNFVDFGNYETAVKRDCGEEGITFSFKIEKLPFVSFMLNKQKLSIGQRSYLKNRETGNVTVSMAVKQLNQRDFKQETQIEFQKPKIQLSVTSDIDGKAELIKLNNKEISILDGKLAFNFTQDQIFSIITANYLGDLEDLKYEEFGLRNDLILYLGKFFTR